MKVNFVKQGGKKAVGTAIGRKGKALLIRYSIDSGEQRERWLPGNRILELFGDIDTLPRWKSQTCPAQDVFIILPVRNGKEKWNAQEKAGDCAKCGGHHLAQATYVNRKTGERCNTYNASGVILGENFRDRNEGESWDDWHDAKADAINEVADHVVVRLQSRKLDDVRA